MYWSGDTCICEGKFVCVVGELVFEIVFHFMWVCFLAKQDG